MIFRTREGHEILAFTPYPEPVVPDTDRNVPLTFAIVAARYQERLLLLFTHERNNWEMPGGGIEVDEAPQACAARELFEETGQVADQIDFKGLFKLRFQPDHRLEYGALFTATLGEMRPFIANAEAERILLWSQDEPLDGQLNDLTRFLMSCC